MYDQYGDKAGELRGRLILDEFGEPVGEVDSGGKHELRGAAGLLLLM